jgi:hypothetical protein
VPNFCQNHGFFNHQTGQPVHKTKPPSPSQIHNQIREPIPTPVLQENKKKEKKHSHHPVPSSILPPDHAVTRTAQTRTASLFPLLQPPKAAPHLVHLFTATHPARPLTHHTAANPSSMPLHRSIR